MPDLFSKRQDMGKCRRDRLFVAQEMASYKPGELSGRKLQVQVKDCSRPAGHSIATSRPSEPNPAGFRFRDFVNFQVSQTQAVLGQPAPVQQDYPAPGSDPRPPGHGGRPTLHSWSQSRMSAVARHLRRVPEDRRASCARLGSPLRPQLGCRAFHWSSILLCFSRDAMIVPAGVVFPGSPSLCAFPG